MFKIEDEKLFTVKNFNRIFPTLINLIAVGTKVITVKRGKFSLEEALEYFEILKGYGVEEYFSILVLSKLIKWNAIKPYKIGDDKEFYIKNGGFSLIIRNKNEIYTKEEVIEAIRSGLFHDLWLLKDEYKKDVDVIEEFIKVCNKFKINLFEKTRWGEALLLKPLQSMDTNILKDCELFLYFAEMNNNMWDCIANPLSEDKEFMTQLLDKIIDEKIKISQDEFYNLDNSLSERLMKDVNFLKSYLLKIKKIGNENAYEDNGLLRLLPLKRLKNENFKTFLLDNKIVDYKGAFKAINEGKVNITKRYFEANLNDEKTKEIIKDNPLLLLNKGILSKYEAREIIKFVGETNLCENEIFNVIKCLLKNDNGLTKEDFNFLMDELFNSMEVNCSKILVENISFFINNIEMKSKINLLDIAKITKNEQQLKRFGFNNEFEFEKYFLARVLNETNNLEIQSGLSTYVLEFYKKQYIGKTIQEVNWSFLKEVDNYLSTINYLFPRTSFIEDVLKIFISENNRFLEESEKEFLYESDFGFMNSKIEKINYSNVVLHMFYKLESNLIKYKDFKHNSINNLVNLYDEIFINYKEYAPILEQKIFEKNLNYLYEKDKVRKKMEKSDIKAFFNKIIKKHGSLDSRLIGEMFRTTDKAMCLLKYVPVEKVLMTDEIKIKFVKSFLNLSEQSLIKNYGKKAKILIKEMKKNWNNGFVIEMLESSYLKNNEYAKLNCVKLSYLEDDNLKNERFNNYIVFEKERYDRGIISREKYIEIVTRNINQLVYSREVEKSCIVNLLTENDGKKVIRELWYKAPEWAFEISVNNFSLIDDKDINDTNFICNFLENFENNTSLRSLFLNNFKNEFLLMKNKDFKIAWKKKYGTTKIRQVNENWIGQIIKDIQKEILSKDLKDSLLENKIDISKIKKKIVKF